MTEPPRPRSDVSSQVTAQHLLVLVIGVVAIGCSAPLIRLATPAPALAIAALRLVVSAPPMIAVAAARRERDISALGRRDWLLLVLSAIALAAHFAFWVASVQRTTILASTVLVTMQPLFVATGAWLVLHERLTRPVAIGIALGLVGAGLLMVEGARDPGTLIGNVFALIGGVLSSVYLVIGRGARQRLSTSSYGAVVYSMTAVILVGVALATGAQMTGHPASAYVAIVALAVVAQLIGHNAMNWALGSLSAAVVAVAILLEPVISSAIATVLLDEMPTPFEVAGGAVVLAGVYVALRGSRAAPDATSADERAPIEA